MYISRLFCVLIIITVTSAPENFTITVLNSTAVELLWQYPDSPTGEIRGYSILYAKFPVTEVIVINITLDAINDTSDQTAVVAGLLPFTKYSFRVRAFSQNNSSNLTFVGEATDEFIVRTAENGK